MKREISKEQVASQILQTIPRLMQVVVADVRSSEYDVLPAQFRLMSLLSRCPSSLSEMAERQQVSLPTISKSVSTLVERGWVTHSISLDDRRVVIAALTPRGQEVLTCIRERTLTRLEDLLERLSPQNLDRLAAALQDLEDLLPAPESLCSD
jgi:DNA-binding MarR family transcriptional regulator